MEACISSIYRSFFNGARPKTRRKKLFVDYGVLKIHFNYSNGWRINIKKMFPRFYKEIT